jgi:bifunctional non-homologous end joining protein LigD
LVASRRLASHAAFEFRYSTIAAFVVPAAPRLVVSPPSGPEWLHEPKLDGWRIELAKAGANVAFYSRHGHDLSDRAKRLAISAAALPFDRVLLDGELVALGADGRPDFLALAGALGRGVDVLRYFAFDLLHLDGRNLRELPLKERQRRLAEVIADAGQPWFVPVGLFPDGACLLSSCERMGIEGVVSKRRAAPYRSGLRSGWRKTKCEAWRAANRERWKLFEK